MSLSKNDVIHVANLAYLNLEEKTVDKFAAQIGKIIDYVDTLNRVDTTNVIPTFHAISLTNAFREDTEKKHLQRKTALENAPEKENGHFVVPKVIG